MSIIRELLDRCSNIEIIYNYFIGEPDVYLICLEYSNEQINEAINGINELNQITNQNDIEIRFGLYNQRKYFKIKHIPTGDYITFEKDFLGHNRENRLSVMTKNKVFICVGQRRIKNSKSSLIEIKVLDDGSH